MGNAWGRWLLAPAELLLDQTHSEVYAMRCPNPNDLIALKWRQLWRKVQLSKYLEICTLGAKNKVWITEIADELMICLDFFMTGNFVLNARNSRWKLPLKMCLGSNK